MTDAVYDSDGNKLSNVLLGVLKDTDRSNVQSDSTTTVPSSALLKATDDKIGDTSSLPGDAGNVVSAINQLNSELVKSEDVTFTLNSESSTVLSKSISSAQAIYAVSILYNNDYYYAQISDKSDIAVYIVSNSQVGLMIKGTKPSTQRNITVRATYI